MRVTAATMIAMFASSAIVSADTLSDLDRFSRALEVSVLQISRPSSVSLLIGAHNCRSYRVGGVGAIFILPPRQLPRDVPPSDSKSLPGTISIQPTAPAVSPMIPQVVRVERLSERERAIRAAELQALAFQQAAAMTSAQAEQAFRAMAQEMENLMTTGQSLGRIEKTPFGSGAFLPPEPPWRYWFEAEQPPDNRTPREVLDAVCDTVSHKIAEHAQALGSLAPGESTTVIVEFYDPDVFDPASRPTRTLVVRARSEDLAAAREGRLAAEELRKKLVYEEY
jgi:hypothetical protein